MLNLLFTQLSSARARAIPARPVSVGTSLHPYAISSCTDSTHGSSAIVESMSE